MKSFFAAFLATTFLFACSTEKEEETSTYAGDKNGSCSYTVLTKTFCIEYASVSDVVVTGSEMGCDSGEGTWAASLCPTEGLVGSCAEAETASSAAYTTRYYATYTSAEAEASCDTGTYTEA